MNRTGIAIMGVTLTGKTESAYRIAKAHNGMMICADTVQFYSGMMKEQVSENVGSIEVPRRLYGSLSNKLPMLTNEEYHSKAELARREAIDKQFLPVFEGCNVRFARLLNSKENPPAKEYGTIQTVALVQNIKYLNANIDRVVTEQIKKYIDEGMISEIQKLIWTGHLDTVPMRSILYRHFAQHLEHNLSFSEALELTRKDWIRLVHQQDRFYRKTPGIKLLEVELGNVSMTCDLVISHLRN